MRSDILANTNQVEFSLTNRLLTKDKNGTVYDFLTWQLRYDRYFDPTFGGAVIAGQRNVIAPEIDLDGFAFLDGPRHYSPVSSVLRVQSRINFRMANRLRSPVSPHHQQQRLRRRAHPEVFLVVGPHAW